MSLFISSNARVLGSHFHFIKDIVSQFFLFCIKAYGLFMCINQDSVFDLLERLLSYIFDIFGEITQLYPSLNLKHPQQQKRVHQRKYTDHK